MSAINQKTNYLYRLLHTVNFFFEMKEEGGGGHTSIIQLIKPSGNIGNAKLREVVFGFLEADSLTQSSIRLHEWCLKHGFSPKDISLGDESIVEACKAYERPMQIIKDQSAIMDRNYYRAARYTLLPQVADIGAQSRLIEWCLGKNYPTVGRSFEAPSKGYHPEHVVPCAAIRDECRERFRFHLMGDSGVFPEDRGSLQECANFIRRLLAVVRIEKQKEQHDLDAKWKEVMPEDWDFEKGCIFDRLHKMSIPFSLSENCPEHIRCTCGLL